MLAFANVSHKVWVENDYSLLFLLGTLAEVNWRLIMGLTKEKMCLHEDKSKGLKITNFFNDKISPVELFPGL